MGKIIYVRHGQASLFSDDYDQLSELGIRQSQTVGDFLLSENITIHAVYCGPLKRHLQTAEAILNKIEVTEKHPTMVEGLREHEGFGILKSLLPHLVENDDQIRELINRPFGNKKEQIKHHLRVYENFARRWINGEFDEMIDDKFTSWYQFVNNAKESFQMINHQSEEGKNVLVVTSGGPKAVACGSVLDLSFTNIMDLSWVIYNASVSIFSKNHKNIILSSFNNISFIHDKSWRTLV